MSDSLINQRNPVSLQSTNPSTNPSINPNTNQQKKVQIVDKDYYTHKENIENHIRGVYPIFNEQFELNKFLNSGSEGYVYEGRYKQGSNNQKYAFKFCIKRDEKKDSKNKFQEISIVKKLHHKNINQILAFIKMDENSYFSVLELGKYGDLDHFVNKLLKRKILSETCINYLAKQILDTLSYIHYRCKIIHMDIKQGNILIDSELNPKIIDFSAACSYAEFDPEDLVKFPFIGTGKYISPEIIKRTHMKIKYAEKIDIYSFGITLYTLVFGIYPYNLNDIKGKQYDKIWEKVNSEKLEFPKNIKVSDKFKDFLSKILDKDYTKRLGIKDALKHPWIKAYDILDEEKQNISNQESFLIKLITDAIPKFNQYIK